MSFFFYFEFKFGYATGWVLLSRRPPARALFCRYGTARVKGGDFARAKPELFEYLIIVFSRVGAASTAPW